MPKVIKVLLEAAILIVVLAALFFSVLGFLARGKSPRELAHNPITRMAVRAVRFQNSLKSRDSRCTLTQAWDLAGDFAAVDEMRASLHVVRDDGQFSLVRSPFGEFWMPARDVGASAEMFLDEQEEIYQPDSHGVRPGDVVLDCGANIGVYTKYALRKGARRVIAIELAPEDIECLRRNLATEIAAGSVTLYPKGVWDKDAMLQLETSASMSSMANSVALESGKKGPLVPLTTIDSIVNELKLDRVDFIKMDIEGAEANALRGASETLRRFKPRLAIALEHRPSDPDSLPVLVKAKWPFYRIRLSACAVVSEGRVQPNVLYGYAR